MCNKLHHVCTEALTTCYKNEAVPWNCQKTRSYIHLNHISSTFEIHYCWEMGDFLFCMGEGLYLIPTQYPNLESIDCDNLSGSCIAEISHIVHNKSVCQIILIFWHFMVMPFLYMIFFQYSFSTTKRPLSINLGNK